VSIKDKTLTEILEMNNGARFYGADFHIHTPKWHQFKLPSGVNRSNKKEIAKLYIEEAKRKEITILGITEHNDVEWVDPVREAAKETEVVIFPGFEITTRSGADGIHILSLFNPDTPVNTLDGLLSNLGLLPEKRFHSDGTPIAITKSMNDIIDMVQEQNGICIAAHMSSDNGLLAKSEGQIRIDVFTNPNLLAGEIPAGKQALGSFERRAVSNELDLYKRRFPIACLNSSDAKSVEDIGKRKSFIKLASSTVEGLREAFLDWESRIRLVDEMPTSPPLFSKIIGVYWEGGFLDGLKFHLNNNLNCIIGGKGTGKSTIIETLRYAFDLKPKTGKSLEQYNEILKEVFQSGSKVTVLIESHTPAPKRYIIERIYGNDPVVKEENGSVRHDLKPKDLFPAEIYGQKEIYEISKKPRFQLAILDRFMERRIDNLVNEERYILRSLEENKNDILRLKRSVSTTDERIAELPALQEKIKRYKDLGIQDKLKEKRLYTKEEQLLKRGLEKLEGFKELFDQFKEEADLDTAYLKSTDGLPNKELLREAGEILDRLSQKTREGWRITDNAIQEAFKAYKNDRGVLDRWEEINQKQDETYNQILRELHKQFESIDPDEFINLEQKVEQLRLIKHERDKYNKELESLWNIRADLLIKLNDNRAEQFRIRERVLKDLNKRLEGVLAVSLEYQGEKKRFIERLRLLRSKVREDQLRQIVEKQGFSPLEFARSVRQGEGRLNERYGITRRTSIALCNAISSEDLFNIEIFNIPTKATIKLNLGTKEIPKFREIDHLSIGQKCTALLTLILLENPYPLIIDQPEDDLDNTFIVEDIVNRLRKEKEHRQFIIATHNANIPVLGDAELIIALNADIEHAFIEARHIGSIDEQGIKDIVRNTLEGGKQAFELRKEKYGNL